MQGWQRARRVVAAAAAVAATVALPACGGGGTAAGGGGTAAPASAATGPVTIAAVIKGLDNPFFQSMQKGIEDESAAVGAQTTVQAATSITDTTGQADKLVGLAGQDFGCYLVNPISGTNLVQGLAQVGAKGKPIVNIDSPVDAQAADAAGAKIATYVGTDNVAAGGMAAKKVAELLPSGGQVAVIGGIAGDVTSGARIDGFTAGLPPNITVAQTVAANWERQEALTQATNIMRAHPDLAGFFVANDDMGLGVAQAIANAGRTGKIRVISVDGNKDALTAVKNGGIDAVVAQYPYAIGLMGMEACQAAAAGKTLPATVEAPVQLVTKENADEALAATPKPFGTYDDPFKALIGS
jgi:ABC-type sugar transport system substrate-binding protein